MIDEKDYTIEVLFSGYMIKYTMVFNELKRSNYGKGSNLFNNILENNGELCFIPIRDAGFRKCLE